MQLRSYVLYAGSSLWISPSKCLGLEPKWHCHFGIPRQHRRLYHVSTLMVGRLGDLWEWTVLNHQHEMPCFALFSEQNALEMANFGLKCLVCSARPVRWPVNGHLWPFLPCKLAILPRKWAYLASRTSGQGPETGLSTRHRLLVGGPKWLLVGVPGWGLKSLFAAFCKVPTPPCLFGLLPRRIWARPPFRKWPFRASSLGAGWPKTARREGVPRMGPKIAFSRIFYFSELPRAFLEPVRSVLKVSAPLRLFRRAFPRKSGQGLPVKVAFPRRRSGVGPKSCYFPRALQRKWPGKWQIWPEMPRFDCFWSKTPILT